MTPGPEGYRNLCVGRSRALKEKNLEPPELQIEYLKRRRAGKPYAIKGLTPEKAAAEKAAAEAAFDREALFGLPATPGATPRSKGPLKPSPPSAIRLQPSLAAATAPQPGRGTFPVLCGADAPLRRQGKDVDDSNIISSSAASKRGGHGSAFGPFLARTVSQEGALAEGELRVAHHEAALTRLLHMRTLANIQAGLSGSRSRMPVDEDGLSLEKLTAARRGQLGHLSAALDSLILTGQIEPARLEIPAVPVGEDPQLLRGAQERRERCDNDALPTGAADGGGLQRRVHLQSSRRSCCRYFAGSLDPALLGNRGVLRSFLAHRRRGAVVDGGDYAYNGGDGRQRPLPRLWRTHAIADAVSSWMFPSRID
ncbi:hypothetical protein B0H17DRAFT_1129401 [Mycena rosella]|uniref:Uncharacterized protein n=1 Tax=Mycena rosella TaxID=1033263 RepID=A0AAD7GNJ7_MYCRO|nr:hypothetical protein B0H17DRAFT_1129401 [Mycena rosella]